MFVQWTPLNTPTSGPAKVGAISGLGVLTGAAYQVKGAFGTRETGCIKRLGVYNVGVLSDVHCISHLLIIQHDNKMSAFTVRAQNCCNFCVTVQCSLEAPL